jgi:hypothetical protein
MGGTACSSARAIVDNDSDGFHFIGYAETDKKVTGPSDLLSWHVVNGLDNPILSTDTVTDPSGPRPYPLHLPVLNVSGADVLTPAQVAPFVPATSPYPPPNATTRISSAAGSMTRKRCTPTNRPLRSFSPVTTRRSPATIWRLSHNRPVPGAILGRLRRAAAIN